MNKVNWFGLLLYQIVNWLLVMAIFNAVDAELPEWLMFLNFIGIFFAPVFMLHGRDK